MNANKTLHLATAAIVDNAGRCLLVRKRGTTHFMQPGGKIEAGEAPIQALQRELHEELNFDISSLEPVWVASLSDVAVNEPDTSLLAEVFIIKTETDTFVPAAEIEEVIWFDPRVQSSYLLAPLTEHQIIPMLSPSR